jgi:hypothetical protein
MEAPPTPVEPPRPFAEEASAQRLAQEVRGTWAGLLRNRRFLLLTTSGACAGAGYAVYTVSVLFVAYGLTGNLLIAGATLFLETGVYTLTFLLAPLVDRARDKRSILLACYPVQAAAAGVLAWALHAGVLSVPLLLVLVLVLAVGWDFVWAVFNVAPRIVLPKDQLFLGDSLGSLVSTGTQVGGYAGGGALLYFVGPYGGAAAYLVLLIAAALLTVPLALTVERPPRTPFWETFRGGWDEFRGAAGRTLRELGALEAYLGFFAAVVPLLITAIAYQRFAHPAAVYGLLVTAAALGGSVAGVGVGALNPRRSVGAILALAPLTAGALCLGLAALPADIVPIAAALAGLGGALTVRYTAKYVWLQGTYPPELLGRLSANLYLFTGASGTAAVLVYGALSLRLPLGALELLTGVGLLVGGAGVLALPSVRRLAF